MKKLLVIALALGVASLAFGQGSQVLSRNAVGYVKVTVPSNGLFAFISTPFEGIPAGANAFTNALGTQLPTGSDAYFWNGLSWSRTSKGGKGWDGVGPTKVLVRGEGFFVKQPNAVTTNLSVFVMGEVPDRITAPTTSVSVAGGGNFTAAAYGYPVQSLWTNTSLSTALVSGDSVYFWDSVAGWQRSTKGGKGWDGVGPSKLLQPGEGFFVKKSSVGNITWSEGKPYTWP